MKRILVVLSVFVVMALPSFGWGREGHEVIAKIAENNLLPRTKERVEHYLGNHSIVYYAKWMDEYRHTDEYKFTTKWHVARVDENLKYVHAEKGGDAVWAINQAVATLRNYKELPDSAVCVNIKYLLHLVGDMHCPAHIYYTGKNQNFKVNFGDHYIKPQMEAKFHGVWDELVIQSSRIWSVSEWAAELDRKNSREKKAMTAGTPQDWLQDNARRCLVQFDMAKEGANVGQDFVNEALPLIETQILYAGYRLASVLNSLFSDPDLRPVNEKDSVAFCTAPWEVTAIGNGATASYAQIRMFDSMQSISVVRYPRSRFRTSIVHIPGDAGTTTSLASIAEEAMAGINGSYFDVRTFRPTTYLRIGKEVYGHTRPSELYRVDGVFAVKGKDMMIAKCDTTEYGIKTRGYKEAIAAGPVLMLEGEIVVPVIKAENETIDPTVVKSDYSTGEFYDVRHPRSVIGFNDEYVYMLVIDGRFHGQGEGTTIYETACISELLGMTYALNLDGGGSTAVWSRETGVISHPYDNRKFDHRGERHISNLIIAK